eukprot:1158555-Pelagomonas_calceolata.AAC.6
MAPQEGRGPTICCLAIPADMSMADFCNFCGAYLEAIRSMRVLRREARSQVVCMVLIRFATQQLADDFYKHFNQKPCGGPHDTMCLRCPCLLFCKNLEVVPSHRCSLLFTGKLPTCNVWTSAEMRLSRAGLSYVTRMNSALSYKDEKNETVKRPTQHRQSSVRRLQERLAPVFCVQSLCLCRTGWCCPRTPMPSTRSACIKVLAILPCCLQFSSLNARLERVRWCGLWLWIWCQSAGATCVVPAVLKPGAA